MTVRRSAPIKDKLEYRATRLLRRAGYHLAPISPEDRRYLDSAGDARVPLPAGAREELRSDNPRLRELRNAYGALDLPVTRHSRWAEDIVDMFVELDQFRGDTLFVWHYRELSRVTALKYFVYGEYVRALDDRNLFERLGEDGAFGCWTFDYEGRGRYSRDLIDSINELYFLDRHLDIFTRESLRVLDVGAGYGRLAHRMAQAAPGLTDYACIDAVPEGTFLSEYYLRHRGVMPPARVIPLHRWEHELEPGSFDLAVNIHSFPECRLEAIEWWVATLRRLEVPRVLIVPNDGAELLSQEPDRSRRDFSPVLSRNGYRLVVDEPQVSDAAVREMLDTQDHFLLFELEA